MSADRGAGRAAALTPPGRGAIAVVAAVGPAALAAVDDSFGAANGKPIAAQRVGRIVFGRWRPADPSGEVSTHREEVVVVRRSADAVEVHCHGGVAAAQRILAAFAAAGCHLESWRKWHSQRQPGALEAAAAGLLAEASTLRTAAILLQQQQGALRRDAERCLALLRERNVSGAAEGLDALLRRAPLGLHLVRPWRVAIGGRANVGKSTLLNALVGYQRAIVFDQPGTTRDVVSATTALDGWPVQLRDAAGLRATVDDIESAGVALAKAELAAADLTIWVLDAAEMPPADLADPGRAAIRDQAELGVALPPQRPALVVLNKIDQVTALPNGGALTVSALTGAGVVDLLTEISLGLVPEIPPPGAGVPHTAEQVGALQAARDHLAAGHGTGACAVLEALLETVSE